MKLRVTPLSGLYSRIFNTSLISERPGREVFGCGSVQSIGSIIHERSWLDYEIVCPKVSTLELVTGLVLSDLVPTKVSGLE